jgi:LPXTG-motif cell wall-anchored protein
LNAEEGHFKGKSIAGYTFVKSEEKDGIITNYYKKVTNHYSTPNPDPRLTPTAETPATPAVTTTVAGTNKDNTYQAPAAKAEDKKELPNTGGKDNVAVASLGFLGLLLGALPFVKRKN